MTALPSLAGADSQLLNDATAPLTITVDHARPAIVAVAPPASGRWVVSITEAGPDVTVTPDGAQPVNAAVVRFATQFVAIDDDTRLTIAIDDPTSPPGTVTLRLDPADTTGVDAVGELNGANRRYWRQPADRDLFDDYGAVVAMLADADDRLSRHVRVEAIHAAAEVAYLLGDEALVFDRYGRAALAYESLGMAAEQATALSSLAIWLEWRGEFDRALVTADRAIAVAATTGNPVLDYMTRHTRCLVLIDVGELDAGRRCAERVIDAAERANDAYLTATARNTLGGSYSMGGRPDVAIDVLRGLVESSSGDERELGLFYNNLAIQFRRLGDNQQAINHYRRALDLQAAAGQSRAQEQTRSNLALVYFLAGDLDRAVRLYRQAIDAARGNGWPTIEADARLGLGEVRLAEGRPDDALAEFARAAGVVERIDEPALSMQLAQLRATAALEAGDFDNAQLALSAALAAEDTFDVGPIDRGKNRYLSGVLALASGRTETAVERLTSAVSAFEQGRYALGKALALEALARHALSERDHAAVDRYATEAIEIYGLLRGTLTSIDLRANYTARRFEPTELLIESRMQRHAANPDAGFDRLALQVAEDGRARTLAEILDTPERPRGDDVAELLATRAELLRELSRSADPLGVDSERSGRSLTALLGELDRLDEKLAAGTVDAAARQSRTGADLNAIMGALGAREIILFYAFGDESAYRWEITRGAIDVARLGHPDEVAPLAWRAIQALRDATPVRRDLAELATFLLGGLASDTANRHLVIVPDGLAGYVPFAALPDPTSGEVLLNRATVGYAPSMTIWQSLRKDRKSLGPNASAVVLSDPVFSPRDTRRPAAARGAESPARGPSLNRLPLTAAEAAAVVSHLDPNNVIELSGYSASRPRLLEALAAGRADLIHIATHGFVNNERPEMTGLTLALPDPDAAQPGFVGLRDIYALDLSGSLVVLSACETALGRELRNEGLLGLTRAFSYAGAGQVIASLWQVQDRSTSVLMQRFYEQLLLHRLPASIALQRAQQAVRSEARWRHPYYWSGFVLQGG